MYVMSFSQKVFTASIDFENNSQFVHIDTTQFNNLWQIGLPQKSFLDSAYSPSFAIITDTTENYPTNKVSSFQVKIFTPSFTVWGGASMKFMHKYDFDANRDGGFIEVQYDDDTNWTNIVLDTDPSEYAYGINFYSLTDTIIGNIPAFSGTSNGWVSSEFEWGWHIPVKTFIHKSLTIRFSIKSDSVETEQEGWLIDNILLELYGSGGGIEDNNSKINLTKVIPNPIIEKSDIYFTNDLCKLTVLTIFNNSGIKIKSLETRSDKVEIESKDFENGMYYYQIMQNNEYLRSGKFVIVR